MAVDAETERDRAKRRYQRTLFDGVAQLYDDSRLGYPSDIVEFAVATAGVGAGSHVLEVGCGTGQLTEGLVGHGFRLTAIDIGASMIAAARHRLDGSGVSFQVVSFEDFAAADNSVDLIVCGTAWHWVDPEVRFRKSARLLRPGGWLALAATGERYDGAFGAALLGMWAARSADRGAWLRQPNLDETELFAATGLFEAAVRRSHAQQLVRPAEAVIAVENTRATSLSWPDSERQEFTAELHRELGSAAEVPLTQQTVLTMARVRTVPSAEPAARAGSAVGRQPRASRNCRPSR